MANMAVTTRGPADESDVETGTKTEEFLATAVKRLNRCATAETENREMAIEDLRFKAGDQWPENLRSSRALEKRPCLTINKMKTFIHQITNDQRQNRPSIGVSPVGDKSDKETAIMLKGLIRQIERMSDADVAYDTAFDSAVTMGWGYWRIRADYEDDDSFDQSLRIERIRNPFRVYMDPDHQQPDGSDAQWCFVSDMITREEFKEQFPGAKKTEWLEEGLGDTDRMWDTQTHIRIADYYYYETKKRTLLHLGDGQTAFKDELTPEWKAMIEDDPSIVQDERQVSAKSVKWCKITSHEVLEKTDWLGESIPVIKVIGDESDIEGKVTYAGITRDAKDPQRMYNFWCTSETELIALAPKAPWIIEEGQIEGYEKMWKEANIKSQPFLVYKGAAISGKPSPPPQRQQFAGPPQGVVNAKIGAAQDMQAVTGIRFDATQQERTYDESGKALRELKRVGDLGNFHYVDNLGRSLRYTGRQLVDLIPKYYDTKRVVTILREDDSEQQATIDPSLGQAYSQAQGPDGNVQKLYNPKLGKYEVAITVGPSFATKRAEAADSMIAFMKVVPNAAPIIADLIAKNMDWPGAEEIATRLETTLPPALQEKGLENLPIEARGVVMNLKQQLQQSQEQLKQAAALLGDKDKDRQIELTKINKDFEAKMQKIQGDLQNTIIKAQETGQQDNQAEMAKIQGDHQIKTSQMLLDHKIDIMKLLQERDLENRKLEEERRVADQALHAELAIEESRIYSEEKQSKEGIESQERTASADRRSGVATSAADRKSNEAMSKDKLRSGERVAKDGNKAKASVAKAGAKAEPKASTGLPDIHIHVGGGKKKISKGKDGSYTSEDIT